MPRNKESFVDHAWDRHHFDVGQKVDLSKCMKRQTGGYTFYLNDVGITHLFINTNAIAEKGFVLYESDKPLVRNLTLDEMLNKFAAVTMSTYVFDGCDYYGTFQPNPIDNRDAEQVSTILRYRIHFPGGVTFYSDGTDIRPAMSLGTQDRTLRWTCEKWCLQGNENLPIYLPNNPEYFTMEPEFIKLEEPVLIKMQ